MEVSSNKVVASTFQAAFLCLHQFTLFELGASDRWKQPPIKLVDLSSSLGAWTPTDITGKYLTIILRNRAEYRLILSRRGRRPSRLKSDDIPRD